MTLPAGTRLGPYEILSAIGAGGPAPAFAPGTLAGAAAWPRHSALTAERRGGGSVRGRVVSRELRRGRAEAQRRLRR